ncbi:MAG: hypothetical protein M3070_01920 [Actinomycetota bacterium]|nr:hypothetical protein [Actinomycetota bacterium]
MMSITTDLRAYADAALEQGHAVLDQAQTQLKEVTEHANGFASLLTGSARGNVSDLRGRASAAVADLRLQAEKAVNLDAIRSAVEPYVSQARGYTHGVTDRANGLYTSVRSDKRVASLVNTAETISVVVDTVVEAVNVRVVKPVTTLTRGARPAPSARPSADSSRPVRKAPVRAPAGKTASKPATTRPAARRAPAKQASARKASATKASARKAPATKAPAKKSPAKSSARKTVAKAPATSPAKKVRRTDA